MHVDEERHAAGSLKRQGQDYYLKPMNCPMHCLIFRARGRSYRELPMRLFEFGTVYRYEKSGVVHGLTRVRGMTQDDAHIYCTQEQMADELKSLLRFVLDLVRDPGGAAFYGPKISVQARDAIGRTWQMSTIQVDFNLPERFELEYQAADGTRQRPVMIHRALFGSIERFFGVLTEHYAGAFPPWLAPVQVLGVPVAEAYVEYLQGVADRLRREGIRVE